MKAADLIIGTVAIALAGVVAWAVWGLPFLDEFAPGPAFAPLLVATCIALFGAGVLSQAVLAERGREHASDPTETWLFVRSGIISLLILVQTALAPWLGMMASALAFTFVLLVLVLRRPLIPSAATSVITVAIVYLIFDYWLGVDLPTGLIGRM